MHRRLLLLPLLLFIPLDVMAQLDLILPTKNDRLLEEPERFYMRTARPGADAWRGGMYGFTRNERRLRAGSVFTRFHEGVDIAPIDRDASGRPLDTVWSIDHGVVVHANADAGKSNYGKYVVIEHRWSGSPFYSLYAHLNEVWVDSGARISQGERIGLLGYTGAGINRARAHVHFEVAMLINRHFQAWYDGEYADGRNYHRHFNGMNLAGVDVAQLYQTLQETEVLSIRDFILRTHEPFYRVRAPRGGRLDILTRYPWLLTGSAGTEHISWEITFDASGLPLAITPSAERSERPELVWVASSPFPYHLVTKYRVRGSEGKARLSPSGQRFMRLFLQEESV